jgi:hypothetical protein
VKPASNPERAVINIKSVTSLEICCIVITRKHRTCCYRLSQTEVWTSTVFIPIITPNFTLPFDIISVGWVYLPMNLPIQDASVHSADARQQFASG